ncbi:MAG TPA: hypothetical protein VM118_00100 [Acidobacteriota bacterium]|nr:hypothetical protein [Acidobacteriota bacterium]
MRPIGRWGVFFWIWLCAVPAWAGFPHLMSFQGRLDDASGVPLPNGDYSVTFRLYDEPEIGILLWNETQTVTTSNGIFAVLLGVIDTVPSGFFFLDSLYLEVQPDGFDPVLPRTRLTMVPYAWHARDADLVGGTPAADLEESTEIDEEIAFHATNASAHHQKTVNASELTTGTVAEGLLPQGAIDSTEIEAESIGANRLANEPGLVHAYTSAKTLTTTPVAIDSANITVPTAGYVLVIANGWFYKFHNTGTGDSYATVSLSTSRIALDESFTAKFAVLSASPTGHTNENFSVSRVMAVGPGQNKLFLVGNIVGTTGPRVEQVHINTLFFPTAYGTVSPPAR